MAFVALDADLPFLYGRFETRVPGSSGAWTPERDRIRRFLSARIVQLAYSQESGGACGGSRWRTQSQNRTTSTQRFIIKPLHQRPRPEGRTVSVFGGGENAGRPQTWTCCAVYGTDGCEHPPHCQTGGPASQGRGAGLRRVGPVRAMSGRFFSSREMPSLPMKGDLDRRIPYELPRRSSTAVRTAIRTVRLRRGPHSPDVCAPCRVSR
jgi:hypothetical protein